jgi:hypothetical protein
MFLPLHLRGQTIHAIHWSPASHCSRSVGFFTQRNLSRSHLPLASRQRLLCLKIDLLDGPMSKRRNGPVSSFCGRRVWQSLDINLVVDFTYRSTRFHSTKVMSRPSRGKHFPCFHSVTCYCRFHTIARLFPLIVVAFNSPSSPSITIQDVRRTQYEQQHCP